MPKSLRIMLDLYRTNPKHYIIDSISYPQNKKDNNLARVHPMDTIKNTDSLETDYRGMNSH